MRFLRCSAQSSCSNAPIKGLQGLLLALLLASVLQAASWFSHVSTSMRLAKYK